VIVPVRVLSCQEASQYQDVHARPGTTRHTDDVIRDRHHPRIPGGSSLTDRRRPSRGQPTPRWARTA
jgi:hypothetical protein